MSTSTRKTDEEIRERIAELEEAVTYEATQPKPHKGVIVSLEAQIDALFWALGE